MILTVRDTIDRMEFEFFYIIIKKTSVLQMGMWTIDLQDLWN